MPNRADKQWLGGGGLAVDDPGGWAILEACPTADEAEWLQHATAFVAAFVTPPKRERWAELLTRRPRQISRNSHKLHSALDRRSCHRVAVLPPTIRGVGLFYGFVDAPRVVPAEDAEMACGGDAIFSLIPGKLAVYFFHESEVWLCQQ
jgi:hypothetical protein